MKFQDLNVYKKVKYRRDISHGFWHSSFVCATELIPKCYSSFKFGMTKNLSWNWQIFLSKKDDFALKQPVNDDEKYVQF